MINRELLEMAAKAVGYEGGYMFRAGGSKGSGLPYDIVGFQRVGGAMWNPLNNDGDALRLAAALIIDIEWVTEYIVFANGNYSDDIKNHGNDHAATVRSVIVRAAAEIGKAMP